MNTGVNRRQLLQSTALILGAATGPSTAAQETGDATLAVLPAASPVSSPVAAVTVQMTSQLRFEPAEVTIKRGETIAWVNASPIPHTTTDDPDKNPVKKTRPELSHLPPGA